MGTEYRSVGFEDVVVGYLVEEMAAVDGAAAYGAVRPTSAWTARRDRQQSARRVGEAKLQAAFGRVTDLEMECGA